MQNVLYLRRSPSSSATTVALYFGCRSHATTFGSTSRSVSILPIVSFKASTVRRSSRSPHKGWVKSAVHTDAECIFQFSSSGKYLPFPRHLNHGRKWRIASGSADHIWLIFIKSITESSARIRIFRLWESIQSHRRESS